MSLIIGDIIKKQKEFTPDARAELENQIYNEMIGIYKMKNSVVDGFAEFLVREASFIFPELLIKKYANIKFREELPIDNQGGWSKNIVTPIYDYSGKASIKNESGNAIPKVGVAVSERIDKVIELPLAIDWKYSELQLIKDLGQRIEQTKFLALRRGFEEQLNQLALFGNADYNKPGLLTDISIQRITVKQGASGSTRWAYKTPQEILQDIRGGATSLNANSNGVFTCNNIYLSNTQYNDILGNPRSDFSDSPVDRYLLNNLPGLERIFGDSFLNNQGADQPTSPTNSTPAPTGIMIVIDKNPEYARFSIPQEMVSLPISYPGTEVLMPYIARAAGFIVVQSASILIYEGI